MIFWIVGVAVAVIAGAMYASHRGWIYLGFRRPSSPGSGVFGELIEAFHPSHSYFAEEMDRDRSVFEEAAPLRYVFQSDEFRDADVGGAEEPPRAAPGDTRCGEGGK